MKTNLFPILLFLCLGGPVFGQQVSITGSIMDENGLPLSGATVLIEGANKGAVANFDGIYTVTFESSALATNGGPYEFLIASFMGYQDSRIEISSKTVVNFVLLDGAESLDEVIVVAYGTTTKKDYTGSAGVVGAISINKVPVTSIEKALAGNVSGVTVAETSGQPGSYSEIRIRGLGSFSASNSPLYVLDGVVISTGFFTENANLMSSIPSGDIESMTVLKDASATSLYGSRAANGVILITTKKGRAGVTKYKIKTVVGVSDFAVDNYKPASGDDFVMLMKESLENYYGVGNSNVESNMNKYEWVEPEGGYTDWYDLLFRQGLSMDYEFSATGGNEKTQFYASANVLDQEGLALNSDFMRYSGRLNLTHKISNKLNLGFNVLVSKTKQNTANNGSAYSNPFYNVNRNTWPTETPYDENGEYKYELVNAGYYNLLREYDLTERTADIFRSMNTFYIEYKPFDFLSFKSTNGYDWINSNYYGYGSPLSRGGESTEGYVNNENAQRTRFTSSNVLTFDKTYNELHHINVLGAFEADKYESSYFSAEGTGLPNESLKVLSVTAIPTSVAGSSSGNAMLSYFSRANYDFDKKYYLSGSFRRDGSSRLGLNERWANFWSVSGAWRLTQEKFMENVDFLDDLKLRASYGTTGTLPSGFYDHLALYSYSGSYDGAGAAVESQIENKDLTWEKNNTFNIGIEFGIFKNITSSIEYFRRHTKDLLMNLPLAPTIGAGSTMVNIGEMENKGVEFEIRSHNITGEDFNWSSSLLFTAVRNKILKLNNSEEIISSRQIRREGLPYYTFYVPIWAGVDPADGSPMWYVVDDEGNITNEVTHNSKEANSAVAGSAEPDFYGSIGNDLSYKDFNLSFMFIYSVGGKIWYQSGYKSWNDGRSPKYVVPEPQVDRWQSPGDIAEHPQRIWKGNNNSDMYSTRFLLDNDYLRLKDVTLSYKIPTSVLEKVDINLYLQGRNLLTFGSQKIMDPEHGGANGYAYFEMPPVKTFTFGLEVGF